MSSASARNIESIKQARDKLRAFLRTVQTEPTRVLEEERTRLEAEAKRETPYRSGRLENSVRVRVSRSKYYKGLSISASARNPRSGYNYAAIQHEAESYEHIKGKSHYLIDPFERSTKRIISKLTSRVRMK